MSSNHKKADRIPLVENRPSSEDLREGQRKLYHYDGVLREYIKVKGRMYYTEYIEKKDF